MQFLEFLVFFFLHVHLIYFELSQFTRLPVPVRLNCRVHMHFPEAVHLGQSEASQLVSVQLLDRKISLWLIRQSCSDVQLTELLIQAPSGQFVHHLHCKAGWETQ